MKDMKSDRKKIEEVERELDGNHIRPIIKILREHGINEAQILKIEEALIEEERNKNGRKDKTVKS
jgi:hypothetical protein